MNIHSHKPQKNLGLIVASDSVNDLCGKRSLFLWVLFMKETALVCMYRLVSKLLACDAPRINSPHILLKNIDGFIARLTENYEWLYHAQE